MLGILRTRAINCLAVACGLLVLGIGGCTKDDDDGPVDPEVLRYWGVVVYDIAVTPSLLEVGQSAMIEVFVTDSFGTALPDEVVLLNAAPGTGGVFSDGIYKTGSDGIATATFTAVSPGSVTITAKAQSDTASEVSATVTIEKHLVITPFGRMVATVTPSLMPADGQSTATVDVEVTDLTGSPFDDMTYVRLAAGEKFSDVDGDGVWTENVDALIYDVDEDGQWDPAGLIDPIVYTDNGLASATFTAGNKPGLVYIKVTAGELGHQISDDIEVSLTPIEPIASIVLTPEWQRVQVKGTGGIEWTRIVAETFDAHGNPAPENLPMDFSVTQGPGGGENIDGDPVGPVSAFTNALGQATVTLNAGSISGTVVLRARSGSVISDATQVTIRSGPPAVISLSAEDCNVPSWGLVGYSNRITAAVVDQWGNEVADSTAVHFGTEQGLIEGAAETEIVPTIRGKAITYWNSGEPRNDPHVYYWCETAGGTVADTNSFLESGHAASGTFLEWPDTLVASADSLAPVIIEVLDINGVFMDTDTPIDLVTDFGTITPGFINDGCNSSTYFGYFNSEVLDQDYSYTIPDDGLGVVATISANCGGTSGWSGAVKVVLITGKADAQFSTIEVASTIAHGATVPVEVKIMDFDGNPLGGHQIEITVQSTAFGLGGSMTGSRQYTNKYGFASGFEFTATSELGVPVAYLSARDLDPQFGDLFLAARISLNP